ncbi:MULTISPECIES: nuclear transport factor 2 family protein [Rhodanobacter]|uniref:nuclear transport factor 2 family protein n=1 Tax=Rhodanobacter TaxID=75309 RepID=UPI000485C413|nr:MULTISPECIES: nuclear transport factor 2 family protein [Rhodanobacter]KZC20713.1 hypothetical protein RHOFW104R3_24195 [Rhodanobacter denitrificans]UJJ52606.1 nuclear transport factor 2 family protein [Rhodanobacter denitrificans]UJM95360.1 nuclear transport factor 2 family protein [Rhodanobacter denitrificans]UJM98891.1 nuclear transport factor 2 family protein [Rhodanobacter denitrificans]UJN21694.1 nuclear transport factor 2 family protein [Rhodanobacter denitrificans]
MFKLLGLLAMTLIQPLDATVTDHSHIRAMATTYVQALESARPESLKQVFHGSANLFWVDANGRLQSLTQPEWRHAIEQQGAQHAFSSAIEDLQVDHDVAMVKLRSDLPDRVFTDYLLLLHAEGRWRVVNKTFSIAMKGDHPPAISADDLAEIRTVLQRKIDASVDSDGGLLTITHHPRAVYYTLVDGQMSADSIAEAIGRYEARRPTHPRGPNWRIVSVDQAGTAAMAKLDATLGEARYVDFINLLKIDGRWQIISAVWADG